jgi:hypothetical protein
MKKSELIAKLEGAKELTSVVSIDLVLAALGMLEDEAPKATTLSSEMIEEISNRIESCLDHNNEDLVDKDQVTFDISYGNQLEVEDVYVDVYKIMQHVTAILEEFESEPEIDSAGFSIAAACNNSSFNDPFRNDITYRFEDEESHHCDDPGCNCSI